MKKRLRSTNPILSPIQDFMETESSSGVVLIASTILALLIANSPLADSYQALFATYITVGAGTFEISKPLILWINDGLMAIFFLMIGLEIKRELLYGELSTRKNAILPLAAAIGGALIPGMIFYFINMGTEFMDGWAIAIATDIAFAVGILALLGSRVPIWAKVLLTATAVVDDLIAVAVIAIFYTAELSMVALGVGLACFAILILMNRFGVLRLAPYVVVGIIMWVAILKSGVHATVAGVLMGFTIPAIRKQPDPEVLNMAAEEADDLKTAIQGQASEYREAVYHHLEEIIESLESPLHKLEHRLHPWAAFFIIPIFAFANAGVELNADALSNAFNSTLTWGIILGLFVGKQVGIFGATALLYKFNLTAIHKQKGVYRILYGLGCLSGIGFTMSLFITGLAFTNALWIEYAKVGILLGSLLSGIVGYLILYRPAADSNMDAQSVT
ncbi:MAG: Na+/H+ antiporter NhaA [Bacteroidota bacterium]